MSSSFSDRVWDIPWQPASIEASTGQLSWDGFPTAPCHRCPTGGQPGCHAGGFAAGEWGGGLSLLHHLSPCKARVGQGLQTHVMDELRRRLVLLPETGALVSLVLLKCFYVLESVVMTQSNSGSSRTVTAFTRVCVCVFTGDTDVVLYSFHPTVCTGCFEFLNS